MKRHLLAGLVLATAFDASAATIYLCKGYGGGYFWAQKYCDQYQATLDRIAYVPDALPWNQQVALAEQQRAGANRSAHPAPQPQPQQQAPQPAQPSVRSQCAAMDAEIASIDAAARQGQSAQRQEQLRIRRSALRDQQYRIGCGRY